MVHLVHNASGTYVEYGAFRFIIEDKDMVHNLESFDKCRKQGRLSEYMEAYSLCVFAWDNQVFDKTDDYRT